MLRLPGKGLPYLNQKRNGDLLVEILVKTPTNLSARQEELLREFESSAEESIGDKIIKGVENLLGGKSKKRRNSKILRGRGNLLEKGSLSPSKLPSSPSQDFRFYRIPVRKFGRCS